MAVLRHCQQIWHDEVHRQLPAVPDLRDPGQEERSLTTPGTRAAVLGSPVAHSLSPVLHTAAYHALGLTSWSYQAIECDIESLPGLLASLGPDWAGLSLTMPLKRAVLPLLDHADSLVADVGGANTVLLRDGRRLGYNTDVPGMVRAITEAGVQADGSVLVVGGGATACSALAALRRTGAADVTVAVRDIGRTKEIHQVADRLGLAVTLIESGPDLAQFDWERGRPRWQLLISTVPSGAADSLAELLGAGKLAVEAAFDVVYEPWPTRLAEAAGRAGATVISGFELLLHQAAGQVELMTGQDAPVADMRAAGLAELRRRRPS